MGKFKFDSDIIDALKPVFTFSVVYICAIYLIGIMTTFNFNFLEWSLFTDIFYRLLFSIIFVLVNIGVFCVYYFD